MTKKNIAFGLLVIVGASSAVAQNVKQAQNPLMRPMPAHLQQQQQSLPQQQYPQGTRNGYPPAPPIGNFNMPGESSGDPAVKEDLRIQEAQNIMAGYNVVAVQGDTAVLRVTGIPGSNDGFGGGAGPGGVQAGGPGSMGGAGQMGLGSAGPAIKATAVGVLPSLVVKHKQTLLVQNVEVTAEVGDNQVVLRTATGKRAIFSGRLEGNSARGNRGINWVSTDDVYTARQSPPVSKNATATPQNASGGQQSGVTNTPGQVN